MFAGTNVRLLIALALLLAVCIVSVSPAADLPATSLRAIYLAIIFFWILGTMTMSLLSALSFEQPQAKMPLARESVGTSSHCPAFQPPTIDITCSLVI